MSREIKFREWDSVREEFMPGHGLSYSKRAEYDNEVGFRFEHMESDEDWADGHRVLEQFTGLKDKNGKDIYEGDILAWHSNIYRKHDWVGLVLYRGAGFAVQESDKSYSSPEWLDCACRKDANIIEVIGNIHENPELLEAEK